MQITPGIRLDEPQLRFGLLYEFMGAWGRFSAIAIVVAWITLTRDYESLNGQDRSDSRSSTNGDETKSQPITDLIGIELIYCPSGRFRMGNPDSDEYGRGMEVQQIDVSITKGFYLGRHEVTQQQWHKVMNTKPWSGEQFVGEGPEYPATYVSWNDAVEFCRRVSQIEGKTYRLPKECEWEYACRAGTVTRFSFGDDWTQLNECAWFETSVFPDSKDAHPHEVGRKKANPWGLYDLHGNVDEWCHDVYQRKLPGGQDPFVDRGGTSRVLRGGSWNCGDRAGGAVFCRSAARGNALTESSGDTIGFRVARDADER